MSDPVTKVVLDFIDMFKGWMAFDLFNVNDRQNRNQKGMAS